MASYKEAGGISYFPIAVTNTRMKGLSGALFHRDKISSPSWQGAIVADRGYLEQHVDSSPIELQAQITERGPWDWCKALKAQCQPPVTYFFIKVSAL